MLNLSILNKVGYKGVEGILHGPDVVKNTQVNVMMADKLLQVRARGSLYEGMSRNHVR